MATVHLICGPVGAGKTTYGAALASRIHGVLLSTDDWVRTLFYPDPTGPHAFDWFLERSERCERQMWEVTAAVVERGVDVVFDAGLSRLEDRDRCRGRGMQTKGAVKLHYLDVDRETRLARVRRRNLDRMGTQLFQVSDVLFEYLESRFEPPTDDELYGAMIVG